MDSIVGVVVLLIMLPFIALLWFPIFMAITCATCADGCESCMLFLLGFFIGLILTPIVAPLTLLVCLVLILISPCLYCYKMGGTKEKKRIREEKAKERIREIMENKSKIV